MYSDNDQPDKESREAETRERQISCLEQQIRSLVNQIGLAESEATSAASVISNLHSEIDSL